MQQPVCALCSIYTYTPIAQGITGPPRCALCRTHSAHHETLIGPATIMISSPILLSSQVLWLLQDDAQIGVDVLGWKQTITGVGHCRQVGCPESGINDAVQRLASLGYKVHSQLACMHGTHRHHCRPCFEAVRPQLPCKRAIPSIWSFWLEGRTVQLEARRAAADVAVSECWQMAQSWLAMISSQAICASPICSAMHALVGGQNGADGDSS